MIVCLFIFLFAFPISHRWASLAGWRQKTEIWRQLVCFPKTFSYQCDFKDSPTAKQPSRLFDNRNQSFRIASVFNINQMKPCRMGKKSEKWKLTNCCQRCILQLLNSIRFYFRTRFAFERIGRRDCVSIVSFLQKYSQSLPETVMKCWPPLGDPCACTTATCAVTCWPFWLWPFEDGSATRICESLESEDSNGTTSMTLTLPEGAVCRIIFFCRRRSDYAIVIGGRNYGLSAFTWLRFTWCKATGVICAVRCPSEPELACVDVPASDSSFGTDVTVMKFLAVANRVAILNAYKNCCKFTREE